MHSSATELPERPGEADESAVAKAAGPMTVAYNAISSRGLDRIAALSDGMFAIAMTLIVLEIRLPDIGTGASDAQVWSALVGLGPRFVTYLLSFLTLGIFWGGQQTQLNYFARANRDLAWIHLTFLAVVALLPFSTSVLADHYSTRAAIAVYCANLALLGVCIYASWAYATHAHLLRGDVDETVSRAVRRRIVLYQRSMHSQPCSASSVRC